MQDLDFGSLLLVPDAHCPHSECIHQIHFCSAGCKVCMTARLAYQILLQRYEYDHDNLHVAFVDPFVFGT